MRCIAPVQTGQAHSRGGARPPVGIAGERASEVQVSTLMQPFPIGELPTESEVAIFGKTEDVELLIVDELRDTLFPKIPLDVPQFLGREARAGLAEI